MKNEKFNAESCKDKHRKTTWGRPKYWDFFLSQNFDEQALHEIFPRAKAEQEHFLAKAAKKE